jgi:hypothetical protein
MRTFVHISFKRRGCLVIVCDVKNNKKRQQEKEKKEQSLEKK